MLLILKNKIEIVLKKRCLFSYWF